VVFFDLTGQPLSPNS